MAVGSDGQQRNLPGYMCGSCGWRPQPCDSHASLWKSPILRDQSAHVCQIVNLVIAALT